MPWDHTSYLRVFLYIDSPLDYLTWLPKPWNTYKAKIIIVLLQRRKTKAQSIEVIWLRLYSWHITDLTLKHRTLNSIRPSFLLSMSNAGWDQQHGLPSPFWGPCWVLLQERAVQSYLCTNLGNGWRLPTTSGSLPSLSALEYVEEGRMGWDEGGSRGPRREKRERAVNSESMVFLSAVTWDKSRHLSESQVHPV